MTDIQNQELVPSSLLKQGNSSTDVNWVDCVRNVMAHAQKPDFVIRRNGLVHLNRRGASVLSVTGSRAVRISGSNAGYTMFRGSVRVLATHSIRQFPLRFPCVTVRHHISTGLNTHGSTCIGICEGTPLISYNYLRHGQKHSLLAPDPVLKIQVLWDVGSCRLVKSHTRFGEQCGLQKYQFFWTSKKIRTV